MGNVELLDNKLNKILRNKNICDKIYIKNQNGIPILTVFHDQKQTPYLFVLIVLVVYRN